MEEKQHKRRVRYSGTHPRTYKEKYKEHQPEKYADTISKVISKGSTPAGMHISITHPSAGFFNRATSMPQLLNMWQSKFRIDL